jgi:hypothetical protein
MTFRRHLCALSILSCLLTLAASGDDFCVIRLVFLGPPAAEELLPNDDPNTDFVESEDVPHQSAAAGHGTAATKPRDGAGLTPTTHAPALDLALPGNGSFSRANLYVPLIC